jgi:hypothetical protein
VDGNHHARPLYPGKDPVTIVQGAGWAPGLVWTGEKNLTPTGIRSPDRPTNSQSLYRMSYPGTVQGLKKKVFGYKFKSNRDLGTNMKR